MSPRPTTVGDLDAEGLQRWYGRWRPLEPTGVGALLADAGVRWCIAGGRAARVGAPARLHSDTDVMVALADLPALRAHLEQDWHLWEAHDGALRPLLPGADPQLGCEQLWVRRDAASPWELDMLLQASGEEWIYKRDPTVRLPWNRAVHTVQGIPYLRPEVALLHKAHVDRQKDREDLQAAVLGPAARAWLVAVLEQLEHHDWARLAAGLPRPATDGREDRATYR